MKKLIQGMIIVLGIAWITGSFAAIATAGLKSNPLEEHDKQSVQGEPENRKWENDPRFWDEVRKASQGRRKHGLSIETENAIYHYSCNDQGCGMWVEPKPLSAESRRNDPSKRQSRERDEAKSGQGLKTHNLLELVSQRVNVSVQEKSKARDLHVLDAAKSAATHSAVTSRIRIDRTHVSTTSARGPVVRPGGHVMTPTIPLAPPPRAAERITNARIATSASSFHPSRPIGNVRVMHAVPGNRAARR